jgi:hypothetical protein
VTLAKTIEHAMWSALQRHAQSALGTIAQIVSASGPGQPVKIAGYFFIENLCKDIATAVEATHGAQTKKENAKLTNGE